MEKLSSGQVVCLFVAACFTVIAVTAILKSHSSKGRDDDDA